jgi:hypothetical protein
MTCQHTITRAHTRRGADGPPADPGAASSSLAVMGVE